VVAADVISSFKEESRVVLLGEVVSDEEFETGFLELRHFSIMAA
jgi:hypothetical protein